MCYRVLLLGLVVPVALLGQQPEQTPRFRAGANLVRVDAYVSKGDVAITDLKVEDFAVYEDDKPQQVEDFQLVAARPPIPQSERIDPTNVRDMRQQAADAARLFTLFFDRLHVSLPGSYHARKPIIETLDRVIGPDDLVGLMTPDMSPGSITFSRRTSSIERFVTDTWHWGKRDSALPQTPAEEALWACYGPGAMPYILRMREQTSLDALEALVAHLDGLRPERKFVMLFTEGWFLFRPDERLSRGEAPKLDPITLDPETGKLRPVGGGDPRTGNPQTYQACDRQRLMLSQIDHEVKFRQLLQRANRANVSFYPIDARGLIVFDTPIDWGVPPAVDAAWLRRRHDELRNMALQTDGEAVLDSTNDISRAMQKVFADVGSYYLLSYYSTNQKLDGRFRRIRVEVKREDANVRARPGYLAPTEAEARAAGETAERARNAPPPTVARALDALAPARGNLPVRVQAVGGRGSIRAIVELDVATAKQPEWMSGGTLKLTFEPDGAPGATAGASQTVTLAVDPGQRSIIVEGAEQPLRAGKYSVRAELTPRGSRLPIQVTTIVTVPADTAEVGTGALALRRGPSTGLAYVPTADPRFRRTERLRIEVPLMGEGIAGTGRVLTSAGQAMPLIVSYSVRTDDAATRQFGVGEVALSPLAAGEYVLELSLAKDGKTDVVTYGFRVIP